MAEADPHGLLLLLDRFPEGWSEAAYDGRRWGVTRSVALGGRSQKVFAEELGGTDFVSANVYTGEDGGTFFRPCEMPAEKVLAFLRGATPEP